MACEAHVQTDSTELSSDADDLSQLRVSDADDLSKLMTMEYIKPGTVAIPLVPTLYVSTGIINVCTVAARGLEIHGGVWQKRCWNQG